METDIIKSQMQSMQAYIEDAVMKLEKGEAVDLSGMDQKVQELQTALLKVPATEARPFLDDIKKMMEHLSLLGTHLEAHHSALLTELKGLNTQGRAHEAYKRTDKTTGNR